MRLARGAPKALKKYLIMKFTRRYLIITFSVLIIIHGVGCGRIKIPSRQSTEAPISRKGEPIKKPGTSITQDQKGKEPLVVNENTWFVLTEKLSLRGCAGENCKVLVTLRRGEELFQTGRIREWIRVRVKATNKEGWVSPKNLGKKRPNVEQGSPMTPGIPQVERRMSCFRQINYIFLSFSLRKLCQIMTFYKSNQEKG